MKKIQFWKDLINEKKLKSKDVLVQIHEMIDKAIDLGRKIEYISIPLNDAKKIVSKNVIQINAQVIVIDNYIYPNEIDYKASVLTRLFNIPVKIGESLFIKLFNVKG